MLVFSVFVNFSVQSGDEFLGRLRLGQEKTQKALAVCIDNDVSGSSYLSPMQTTPQSRVPGKTYGDFGTVGVTMNKDRCAGNILREYYCDTEWHQSRADIDCIELGLECLTDSENLGYCG